MDIASFIGILTAIGAIIVGQHLEGGHLGSILQVTAALIVFGGTCGAVMLQYSLPQFLGALTGSVRVFFSKRESPETVISQIVEFARRARREGILSLEKEVSKIDDPFFSKALTMAVDGLEPKTLFETMETELETMEKEGETKASVWEAAGGYAPTVGILGAVLGLIHVMENLNEPEKLGGGIAVAFVATVYGVGAANLLFLPIAGKLKMKLKEFLLTREIVLKGVLLIQEGINHSIIEEELKSFLSDKMKKRYETVNGGADRK